MKTFPQVLVTVGALLSVASATTGLASRSAVVSTSFESLVKSKSQSQTQSRRRMDDDGPWDKGTKVYNNFPNEGWWSGTITSYSETTGMYTVTWEDGSTDYYDDGDKIDEMVAYAQNDPENNINGGSTKQSQTYSAGTPVSMFEEGEWYDGVVVKYGSGTYTVKWADGEMEEIQDGAIMDQMVQDAGGDDDAPPSGYEGGPSTDSSSAISVGTPVSYYANGEWIDGKISSYSQNTYTVSWTDGTTDQYSDSGSDLEELNKAIADAMGDDDNAPADAKPVSGPKFAIDTPVADFEYGEWIEGKVVGFEDGSYVVVWEDEDDAEYYASSNAEDMQELKKMVQDANGDDDAPPASFFEEKDLWELGTPVAVTEDDILWYGKISSFSHGEYKITWESGEEEWLENFDLVNAMVSNAALHPKRTGMSALGKTFLSLFLIGVCAAGTVFGYKFYEVRQEQLKREHELALEDGGSPSYRDEPDDLPKII
mmetsp:Transcript_23306/g.64664  ORF Transcript_23306/g.64664 Transcript_23306/m.64664 type:complete len:482 (+) Transcript_23306:82-1527(+)